MFCYATKWFQILNNQYKFPMNYKIILKNWGFDMNTSLLHCKILATCKWFEVYFIYLLYHFLSFFNWLLLKSRLCAQYQQFLSELIVSKRPTYVRQQKKPSLLSKTYFLESLVCKKTFDSYCKIWLNGDLCRQISVRKFRQSEQKV